MSSSEDCLASSLLLGSGWSASPNVKLWRLLGRFTPSRLWSKLIRRMSSSEDCLAGSPPSRLWSKAMAECQALKIAWHVHPFQALVEAIAECQALKIAWQVHSFQALVETHGRVSSSEDCLAGSLLLGSGWSSPPSVKLWRLLGRLTPSRLWLKSRAQCQALKIAWQVHSCQALVEVSAECQALKIAWQVHSFPALFETRAELKVHPVPSSGQRFHSMPNFEDCSAGLLLLGCGWSHCRISSSEDCLAGSLLPRLFLKLGPNVKIWRLLGRFTLSEALVEVMAECQDLKIARQVHSF